MRFGKKKDPGADSEVRLCPLNDMRPCRPGCGWRNGEECAVLMLAREAFYVVEQLGALRPPDDNPTVPDDARVKRP